MSRDILAASDAINRAQGVSRGLGALVVLLEGAENPTCTADVEPGAIAELLCSIQRDLDGFLDTAKQRLGG